MWSSTPHSICWSGRSTISLPSDIRIRRPNHAGALIAFRAGGGAHRILIWNLEPGTAG
jgi:hypothetical protein